MLTYHLADGQMSLIEVNTLGTNFGEILIKILTFSFKEMYLNVLCAKRQPFCSGLNAYVLMCL